MGMGYTLVVLSGTAFEIGSTRTGSYKHFTYYAAGLAQTIEDTSSTSRLFIFNYFLAACLNNLSHILHENVDISRMTGN
jgi:hypothetical protein